jgi:hypothetical protein
VSDRSKFTGLFDDRLKKKPAVSTSPSTTPSAKPLRGKRSDPEYKAYTIMLKKQTHRQGNRLLEDMENGQDLSDLMQELLAAWVEKHTDKKTN